MKRAHHWPGLLVRLKEGSIEARGRIFYDCDDDVEDPLGGNTSISPTTWRDHDLDMKFLCLCKPNQVHSIYQIEFERRAVNPYLKRGGGGTPPQYPWEVCAMELKQHLKSKAEWPPEAPAQVDIILDFVVWERANKRPEKDTVRRKLDWLIDRAKK